MQPDIHPDYQIVEFICSCGHSYKVGSTYNKPTMRLEVCSQCHPFYTGKQKLVDTGGRVDRFRKRYAVSNALVANSDTQA